MELRLRLPDEVHGRLRAVAEEDGNSLNTEIVIAIEEHLARRQTSAVRGIARKVAQRDAELLRRLSQ
ncbi:Arc family DNA-binding protein [Herbidospora yilanensis]|uniref:Arc family DNA-binding protein n=1 Tax=Herbidospora yilanensis TaxID=354426 RepID=UPI0007804A67|nr:Arc family DNA-binding protein [Herbidospora yilanensis]